MANSKADAQVRYLQLLEEDKDKTFLDILPAHFKNNKRSLIRRGIMERIDEVTTYLNECPLYEGRIFDKKEIVRYVMSSVDDYELSLCFIPYKGHISIWMKHYEANNFVPTTPAENQAYRDKNEKDFELCDELDLTLRFFRQMWQTYEDWLLVRNNAPTRYSELGKDGFPRTSRGNLCYYFIPVKGGFPPNLSEITLFNPRTKKDVQITSMEYKASDNIYSGMLDGKKVFLADYESIDDAWSDLFDVNKEIYSGWWNKVLINKS